MLTTPPAVKPNSADMTLDWTLNSCTASTVGFTLMSARYALLLLPPSMMKAVERTGAAVDADRGERRAAIHEAAVGRPGLRLHARRKHDQRQRVAAVERQIRDAPVLHHLADGRAAGIHQRSFARDFDGLGGLADIQPEIDFGALVHLQGDSGAHGLLEAGLLRRDRVGADRQRGSREEAFAIRGGGEAGIGAGIEDANWRRVRPRRRHR